MAGYRLVFVSSDIELNVAAGAEGFKVFNPQQPDDRPFS